MYGHFSILSVQLWISSAARSIRDERDRTGHRENILDPRFDTIGIGVFNNKDEGNYITQDFMTSLEDKSEKEFREMLEKQINARRAQNGLGGYPFLLIPKG
ncbi:MAG: CAP domain-containing protein [Candidatus Aminicenantes bacterium]|nr:CAP domain-containing protein [Candidatus Aminicenantes bacterium]